MLKNFLVSIALMLLIASSFTACKKDKEKQSTCRVLRLTRDNGQTYDFTYGDDGKLKSMLSLPINELSSFSYNGNTTTVTVTKNGNFSLKLFVTNNNDGLATNVLAETSSSGLHWYNQAITYEGRKIMRNEITDSGANDSTTAEYIWEAGNPTVLVSDGEIFHYEYYKEKPFQPGDWRDIQQLIGGYRIYHYQNLLQSSEINGKKFFYTYKFNESGRITEATETSTSHTIAFKLEYECD